MANVLTWTRAEVLLFEGRKREALELMGSVWSRLKQRESLAMFGVGFVQCLLEVGQVG